jgi:hypothetical protein
MGYALFFALLIVSKWSEHPLYKSPQSLFEKGGLEGLFKIEAPCSKTSASSVESLQGIFDPQGSYHYPNRSLTP